LFVYDNSAIVTFGHQLLILCLQLYLTLRVQVHLAVRAALVLLRLLDKAFVAALYVLSVAILLDQNLPLHLCLLIWVLALRLLFVVSLVDGAELLLLHFDFVWRVGVQAHRVLEEAVRVLDEDLVDLLLISLHLDLNLRPVWKGSRLLAVLQLELASCARNYERLIHSADDLRSVEGCIIELLQALMFLNLFRSSSIGLGRRVAPATGTLADAKTRLHDARRATCIFIV